jgi:hypothetical protein
MIEETPVFLQQLDQLAASIIKFIGVYEKSENVRQRVRLDK